MRPVHLAFMGICCVPAAVAAPKQVGTMPVPVITDLQATSTASFDPASGVYRYDYTLTSGPGNKGDIWTFHVNEQAPADYVAPRSTGTYTLLRGKRVIPFDQERDEMSYMAGHPTGTLVEMGIAGPPGWSGSVTVDGDVGAFFSGDGKGPILSPGSHVDFTFTSPDQPVIKDMEIEPDWVLVVDGEADEEEQREAGEVSQQLVIVRPVLAPGFEWPGSREHWDHFRSDIDKARALGWIADPGLAAGLQQRLAAARRVFDAQGGAAAVPALRDLLGGIEASAPAQRNDAAYALLKLNTEALIAHASDTLASRPTGQSKPHLSLTPEKQSPLLGSTATVTARLVDQGRDDAPIAGYPLELRVVGGLNAKQAVDGVTDASGKLTIQLHSDKPGHDLVELRDRGNLLFAQVDWGGGARLAMEYFFPPSINWDGRQVVDVEDRTGNWGDEPAGPSVTRYYVSKTWYGFDPHTARVVGERAVPALQPHETSAGGTKLTLPADLAPGIYFMVACVDVNHAVPATRDDQRCSVQGQHPVMMAAPAGH